MGGEDNQGEKDKGRKGAREENNSGNQEATLIVKKTTKKNSTRQRKTNPKYNQ